MTPGEQMVWAAEFVRSAAENSDEEAAESASELVWHLRYLAGRLPEGLLPSAADHRAMLDEMTRGES